MQVKRLIELLSEMDPDAHVFVGDGNEDRSWDAEAEAVSVAYEGRPGYYPGAVVIEAPTAPSWDDL